MSAETFNWQQAATEALDGSTFTLGKPIQVDSVLEYRWMVIVGGIIAFAMAWGIGANDVANAFATSVGAGSLSLRMACVIAAIFEFAGALLMGGDVTDTVRKKIIDPTVFNPLAVDDNGNRIGAMNGPELLMTGFLVALFAASTWLVFATYMALPVSTTHSIIGALVGVGLAYRGRDAVVWISDGEGFGKLKGVVGVVISWIISPILSAIIAVAFFLIVRTLVLRRNNPYKMGLIFMPFFFAFAVGLTIFFIIYKGDKRFSLDDKLSIGEAFGIAIGAGVVVAAFVWFVISPLAKRSVEKWEQRELEKIKNPEIAKERAAKQEKIDSVLQKVGVNVTIKEELDEDVIRMHDNVEKFDPKTEQLFTWVQVFTAAFDAFAHGANDVANSIAPFASIYQLHRNNGVLSEPNVNKFESSGTFSSGQLDGQSFEDGDKIPDHEVFCGELDDVEYFSCAAQSNDRYPDIQVSPDTPATQFDVYDEDGVAQTGDDGELLQQPCYTSCNPYSYAEYDTSKQEVPLWILALGGAGIVLGLAMWGYRIIVAIGVKLTKLTPSRGFSIEIGAAITVLIASRIGIPVSTTHCQVGATMGVGLVEFKSSTVNWKQFLFICLGWIFTVIFTGLVSAVFFLVITRSPAAFSVPQGQNPTYCPGNRLFVLDVGRSEFRGIGCSGVDRSFL